MIHTGGCALLLLAGARAFPYYDNPRTADPAVEPSGATPCAVVELFSNATLNNYNLVLERAWAGVPASCPAPWGLVALRWHGEVTAGVQFDRYGALWLDDVELLRTTTPEPSSATNIRWQASKDLTRYSALFSRAAGTNATLTIPNTVNEQYNGVITVNASLAFYSLVSSAAAAAAPPPPDAVVALRSPVAATAASSNPWSNMAVKGNCSETHCRLATQARMPGGARNVISASLDVFASGHSCEEFWCALSSSSSSSSGARGQARKRSSCALRRGEGVWGGFAAERVGPARVSSCEAQPAFLRGGKGGLPAWGREDLWRCLRPTSP